MWGCTKGIDIIPRGTPKSTVQGLTSPPLGDAGMSLLTSVLSSPHRLRHQSDLMLPDMNGLQGTIYVSVCCQMFVSVFLGSVDSGPVLKQRTRVQGVMAASQLTEQEAERSWLWAISLSQEEPAECQSTFEDTPSGTCFNSQAPPPNVSANSQNSTTRWGPRVHSEAVRASLTHTTHG